MDKKKSQISILHFTSRSEHISFADKLYVMWEFTIASKLQEY